MIDNLEVVVDNYKTPCTNYLEAKKKILDVIVEYHCSLSDLKWIVDEIVNHTIAENKIDIKFIDPA